MVPNLHYAKLRSRSDVLLTVLLTPRPRAAVLSTGHWEGLSARPPGSLLHCRSPQVPPDTHRCPPRSEPDGTPVRLLRNTASSDSHTYRTSHTRSHRWKPALSIVRNVSNYTTAPSWSPQTPGNSTHRHRMISCPLASTPKHTENTPQNQALKYIKFHLGIVLFPWR